MQLTDQLYWADPDEAGGISNWDGASVTRDQRQSGQRLDPRGHHQPGGCRGSGVYPGRQSTSPTSWTSSFWDLVNNQIRIGAGDGEPIVALKTWQETNLLVFKRRGVWSIDCNPTAVNAADFSVAKIHNTIGCVARRSVCQVGQDIWFL